MRPGTKPYSQHELRAYAAEAAGRLVDAFLFRNGDSRDDLKRFLHASYLEETALGTRIIFTSETYYEFLYTMRHRGEAKDVFREYLEQPWKEDPSRTRFSAVLERFAAMELHLEGKIETQHRRWSGAMDAQLSNGRVAGLRPRIFDSRIPAREINRNKEIFIKLRTGVVGPSPEKYINVSP